MNKNGPIVCIGVMVADLIGGPLERTPDPGGLVLVNEMGLYPGGGAINTAVALSELDLEVEIIGKVGNDPLGGFLINDLGKRAVGTRFVQKDAEVNTSATMVMVDPDGDRRFVHYIGANAGFTTEDIDFEVVKAASVVHVAGAMVMPGLDGKPLAGLLRDASRSGAITCLDTAWDESDQWLKILEPMLPFVDYFLPSLAEAQAMTGCVGPTEAAAEILQYGTRNVAVKLADEGCLLSTSSGESFHIPAYEVDSIDATGAGDCFNAGLIAGIYMGWSLEESAYLANAMGALCVTEYGASGALRSLSEVKAFMATTPQRIPAFSLI
jgi:sugar/nucleoside kinase (ribokinase family)